MLAFAGRAGWTVIDQALSSLSNLLLSILVARAVDTEAFGAFTVAFTVYSVAVLISRSLTSQPLMMRFAAVDAEEFRSAAAMSSGAASALGFALGTVVLILGLALGGSVGTALLAVALLLPGLLVQDVWRIAFFAQRRPEMAVVIDAAWMVLQVAGVAVFLAVDVESAVPYVIAWGLAGAAAAALGAYRGGAAPRIRSTWTWLKAHWDITRYVILGSLLLQGAYQGALMLVGVFGTLTDVGSLRGAQVILGPVSLLAAAAFSFAVPELARRSHLRTRRRVVAAAGLGGVLATAGLVWGTIALLLPTEVGVALLGDSWPGVRAVLLATAVGQIGNLIAMGPNCVVYAMGRSDSVFRVHAAVSVLLLVGGTAGVWLGGAVGAAWGMAAAYWAVLPFWFWALIKLARVADTGRDAPPVADGVDPVAGRPSSVLGSGRDGAV